VILAVLLAGLFIGNLYRVHTARRFHSELDHHLGELIAMTHVDAEGMPHVAQQLSDPQFNAPGSGLYWQVDGGRDRLARSASLGKHRLTVNSQNGDWETGWADNQPLLQRSARVTIDGVEVVATIGSAHELMEAQVSQFWGDLTL